MTDQTLYKVLVTEDLFVELGADRVEWGHKDKDGFYAPQAIRDDEALGKRLHRTVHPGHQVEQCPTPAMVAKMIERFRA